MKCYVCFTNKIPFVVNTQPIHLVWLNKSFFSSARLTKYYSFSSHYSEQRSIQVYTIILNNLGQCKTILSIIFLLYFQQLNIRMQMIGLHIKFPTYLLIMPKQILNNPKHNIATIHYLLLLCTLYDASQSSNYLVYQILNYNILHSYKSTKHVCQSGRTTLSRLKSMASVGRLVMGRSICGFPLVVFLLVCQRLHTLVLLKTTMHSK